MIQISGVPWAWGFEDGAQGKSIYTGYHLFTGKKLVEYKRGWGAGRRATTTNYVPFQQAPEAYRNILPAEQREDWVGS